MGERIIDEQVKDTLQDLANSQITSNDSSDDERLEIRGEVIPSGMVIEVKQKALTTQCDDSLKGPGTTTEARGEAIVEPASYVKAIACDQCAGSKNAMKEEFASLKANETWDYIPAGNEHAIGCWWVY